jgi:hypothetical protein
VVQAVQREIRYIESGNAVNMGAVACIRASQFTILGFQDWFWFPTEEWLDIPV